MMSANSQLTAILTTVQEPTACVYDLDKALQQASARLIVIGDKKGPTRFEVASADFYSLDRQKKLPFRLAKLLPTGHYSRKNLGYLIAISSGTECIYETDDDNAPLSTWAPRTEIAEVQKAEVRPWLNVYRLFNDELIWPRGFPLSRIRDCDTYRHDSATTIECVVAPIQQGLANNAPDVDALWRLVLDRIFVFDVKPSIWIPPKTYCPFNSQTTWWWPTAYPLMYLPTFCSFRMTDIWRSFIAQRCLWETGSGLVFHSAETSQLRNEHDLMDDFSAEVSGYLTNEKIARTLNDCVLEPGITNIGLNLRRCYEALCEVEIFSLQELTLVDAWLDDLVSQTRQP